MPDRIALKRLTPSDLTFFEWHFRNQKAGNQKAINLNADVFVGELYPSVPAIGPTMNNQIPVNLTVFGPGLKGPYPLSRKIVKTESYKNWRLNGEFVHNPDGDPGRFNPLKPRDLALFIFNGDPAPVSADIVFVAANVPEDASLHAQLISLMPEGRSMISLTRADLGKAGALATIPTGHPIQPFLVDSSFEAALEDAAFGDEKGTHEIRRRKGRRVSSADLAKARQNADRVGRDGEALVSLYLESQKTGRKITSAEWTAADNAVSPYDFKVTTAGGQVIKIDAKSTEGEFGRDIHISAAEIAEAATSAERYDLYRVYGINEEGAMLKIAEDIRPFALAVKGGLGALPPGVRPDSFSVDPAALTWGGEIYVERPDEPGTEEI